MHALVTLVVAALLPLVGAGAMPPPGTVELVPPPTAADALPLPEVRPAADDHVVRGTETIDGGEHRYRGRIIVPAGSRLRIVDATVVFEVAAPPTSTRTPAGQQEVPVAGIVVAPGGRLDVDGAVLTNDERQGEPYAQRRERRWSLWLRGSAHLERCTVAFATQVDVVHGPATIRGCTITDTYGSGIYVRDAREQVTIVGNTIRRNGFLMGFGGGVYLINTNGVVVESNVISQAEGTGIIANHPSTTGSYVWDDDPRIAGNLIFGAPRADDGMASTAIYSSGGDSSSRIADNAILTNGTGIFTAYGAGAQVLRNTLVGVPAAGEPRVRRPGLVAATRPNNGDAYVTSWSGNDVSGFPTAFQNQWEGQPLVTGNDLLGTTGVNNIASTPDPALRLVARANWYGDPAGPRDDEPGDGSIPAGNAGTGAAVLGNVDYEEWRSEPAAGPRLSVSGAAATAGPGVGTVVPLTVTNRGGAAISADVHLGNVPASWTVDAPPAVVVPARGTVEIRVEVRVPPGADPATLAVGLRGLDAPVAAGAALQITPS